jgi:hypothetical protein
VRTWIEYGFKQIKHELGWADHRLTDDGAIERWWELVFSAYVMVSLQTLALAVSTSAQVVTLRSPARRHPWWEEGGGWKRMLNNLRFLSQPVCLHDTRSVLARTTASERGHRTMLGKL